MKNKMNYLVLISRILVGLVFLFSSFVKGVDPLGTAYQIEDYMLAFNTPWATPLAFTLSILLCAAEFTIGVALIFNVFKRFTSWVLLLMMCFFLVLTFIDALTGMVPDCGCFGNAIKMTQWQTFWKNVVLMFPTIIIFIGQRKQTWKGGFKDFSIALLGFGTMAGFCLYNYYNEPMIDFRPWKVGTHVMAKESERGTIQAYVTYKNKKTGETDEFLSTLLMEKMKDTTWSATWEFVDSKVIDPNEIHVNGFSMLDEEGNDHAKSMIGQNDFLFIIASYNLEEMPSKGLEEIKEFYSEAEEKGYRVIFLTASLNKAIEQFKQAEKAFEYAEFYGADEKAIKTMIRSNPGLVLLKNGTVLGKWHYRNIPDLEEIHFSKLAAKYNAN